ncbi:MAG TPA: DUF4199 domain-containing protein [Puia sp.]|nr:DUF4199 domain-containing protein [Puia sp.]
MKTITKYGLWTGLISGLWGIVSFTIVSGLNGAFFHKSIPAADIRSVSGLFSILILAMGIYWGIREEKRKMANTLTFGQAVKTGTMISLITAVLASIFTFLYCTKINPGYSDFMVRDTQQTLTEAGKSPDEINQRLASVRKEFSTGAQVAMALVGQLVMGTIATLIIGLFLRTKTK